MNHDDDLPMSVDPQRFRHGVIKNPVVMDHLHFQIVITRPQCPQLVNSTFYSVIGDARRVSSRKAPRLLTPG